MNLETTRNSSIDFTKGVLVMVMVLYHSLNYFMGQPSALKYISFVTGGFVFISGLMISNIYLTKYNDKTKLAERLFIRGIKLLSIFVLLNVGVPFILKTNYQKTLDANILIDNFYSVFVIGNNIMVIFRILLPISYLLLLAGILIFAAKERIWMLKGVCLVIALFGSVYYFNGSKGYNFIHLTIGMWGILVGFMSLERVDSLLKYFFLLIVLYVVHTVFLFKCQTYYPLYLFSILINLTLFYLVSLKRTAADVLFDKLILLGKYSLLSYIAQIMFLQIFYRIVRPMSASLDYIFPSFIIVGFFTVVSIQIVESYRKKTVYVDRLYKFVFA